MTTASFVQNNAPRLATNPHRAQSPSFRKFQPRAYPPWRLPMSERQLNASFERRILPKLTALLQGVFRHLSDSDREEAVQDSICQALEIWRALGPHQGSRNNGRPDRTALALARSAGGRYLAGVRFAAPRSDSRRSMTAAV